MKWRTSTTWHLVIGFKRSGSRRPADREQCSTARQRQLQLWKREKVASVWLMDQ